MLVKILQTNRLAQKPYEPILSFHEGEEREVSDEVAAELIKFGHAKQIEVKMLEQNLENKMLKTKLKNKDAQAADSENSVTTENKEGA